MIDVAAAAHSYLGHPPAPPGHPRVDPAFCIEVAEHFDAAPTRDHDPATLAGYATLKTESVHQYQRLVAAGLRVEPWRGPGQPYRGHRDLATKLEATGTLQVYLTESGYGRGGPIPDHPMCEPSGISAGGVPLLYNDVFRVVHDMFGHVLHAARMDLAGEFTAALGHLRMYSPAAHSALFVEQISQICWFFYGPHLRRPDGTRPCRGQPGWTPPAERPYPEQKVVRCPPHFLTRFMEAFA